MKKSKQNRYASQLGLSVIGGRTFTQRKRKVSAETAKERMNERCIKHR